MRRVWLLPLALTVAMAACSDDSENTPIDEGSAEGPEATIETLPPRTGTVTVEIDGVTYTAAVPGCRVDADDDSLEILAMGTSAGIPIRIEYGQATGGKLGVFINVKGPLDAGERSYIGEPDFVAEDGEATAKSFDVVNSATGAPTSATATLSCS